MNINYGTSVFVVPSVVNEYLSMATPEQLKVILCLLQAPQKSMEEIALDLQMTIKEVEKAVKFWESKQVLQSAEKGNLLPESDMPFAVDFPDQKPKPQPQKKALAPKINMSPSEIAKEREKFSDLDSLMTHVASSILGRELNYMEQQNIILMREEYEFSPESIAIAIEHFAKKGKGVAYTKKVLIDWYHKGLGVEEELERMIRATTFKGQICKIFKVDFERVSDEQDALIKKWQDIGYSIELIKYAYNISLNQKNKLNWKHIDGILKKWAEQGASTPEQAKQKDEEYRKNHPYTAYSTSKKKEELSPEQTERVNKYLQLVNQFEEDETE